MSPSRQSWQTTAGDTVKVWASPSGDQWYWHVQAANGEIVEGGEGYTTSRHAIEAAERHHPKVVAE